MAEFKGELGHLSGIESPWGNAGGVVKTVEDVEQMAKTGVGWIEAGSYTLEPRPGNAWNPDTQQFDRTVYYHNPETGETYNSLGMPNKGLDVVETEIPEMVRIAHAHNKKLLVNVAPVTAQPSEESLELVARSYAAGADGVILNAGCPNVLDEDGKPHEVLSRSPDDFRKVLEDLDVGRLMVRISPQMERADVERISKVIRHSLKVTAVFTPNTWMVAVPQAPEGYDLITAPVERVGMSGPALADVAAQETYLLAHYLEGPGIDVISSSGITNAHELQLRMDLGAVAGAGSTFFYESQNGWKEDTDKLLTELATDN